MSGGKLLAVPTIPDSTGLSQARASMEALQDWHAMENVIGVCYDTTSSNTGKIRGAVVRLGDMLKKQLLHLECIHHIMELIIGAVVVELFGKDTTGPSDPKFEALKRRHVN